MSQLSSALPPLEHTFSVVDDPFLRLQRALLRIGSQRFGVVRRIALFLLVLFTSLNAAAATRTFGFDDVAARAKALAAAPFKAPPSPSKEVQGLNHDQYRDIRFKPERAHWRGAKLPFEVHDGILTVSLTRPGAMHDVPINGQLMNITFDVIGAGSVTLQVVPAASRVAGSTNQIAEVRSDNPLTVTVR